MTLMGMSTASTVLDDGGANPARLPGGISQLQDVKTDMIYLEDKREHAPGSGKGLVSTPPPP